MSGRCLCAIIIKALHHAVGGGSFRKLRVFKNVNQPSLLWLLIFSPPPSRVKNSQGYHSGSIPKQLQKRWLSRSQCSAILHIRACLKPTEPTTLSLPQPISVWLPHDPRPQANGFLLLPMCSIRDTGPLSEYTDTQLQLPLAVQGSRVHIFTANSGEEGSGGRDCVLRRKTSRGLN